MSAHCLYDYVYIGKAKYNNNYNFMNKKNAFDFKKCDVQFYFIYLMSPKNNSQIVK